MHNSKRVQRSGRKSYRSAGAHRLLTRQGRATVDFDPSAVSAAELCESVDDIGFATSLLQELRIGRSVLGSASCARAQGGATERFDVLRHRPERSKSVSLVVRANASRLGCQGRARRVGQ